MPSVIFWIGYWIMIVGIAFMALVLGFAISAHSWLPCFSCAVALVVGFATVRKIAPRGTPHALGAIPLCLLIVCTLAAGVLLAVKTHHFEPLNL